MWEPAVSGTGNVHDCTPKLQAYPPIFSLTPKASGSTRLQSCEDRVVDSQNIKNRAHRYILHALTLYILFLYLILFRRIFLILFITPVYNFIINRLADESAVLKPLSLHNNRY